MSTNLLRLMAIRLVLKVISTHQTMAVVTKRERDLLDGSENSEAEDSAGKFIYNPL